MTFRILLLISFLLPGAAFAQGEGNADANVEAMLEQVGGRDTWAAARGFHMVEILDTASFELPLVREY